MSILSDLAETWPMALIAAGVGFVVTFGRDPKADEHDLSDYHEPVMVSDWYSVIDDEPDADDPAIPAPRKPWAEMDAKADFIWNKSVDILPPAPAGMDAGSPLWRELVVETAVPTLSDDEVRDIAARWLREAGEQARAEMAGAR